MIISEYVNVRIEKSNKKHYIKYGYKNIKVGEIICVHHTEVPKNSSINIEVECDYCKVVYITTFARYNQNLDRSNIKKCACKKCITLKRKESTIALYGVENISQLSEVQNKVKETNFNKYGTSSYTQTQECKDRIKTTNLQRYGVTNAFQNTEIQNKQKETCLKKYGVENVFQNENIKEKSKNTMLMKYGVKSPIQLFEIRNIITEKSIKTRCDNKTATCSKQQRYIHSLTGGELNYPILSAYLDIAFPDEKIYIEYNGGGHNLDVKLGRISHDDFKKKELRRYFLLRDMGWKQIVIESPLDYLPIDSVLINEIKKATEELINSNDKNHIVLEMGSNKTHDKYGELRKIINLPQDENETTKNKIIRNDYTPIPYNIG